MSGVKHDQGKPRVDLVPVSGILAAARGFGYGAEKYSPWNWASGLEWLRLYGAILRHLFAWVDGEETDGESGLHHLDHAMASLMMLQTSAEQGLGKDNRPYPRETDTLPREAFASYEAPEYWRISLECGRDTEESGLFEGRRWSSYEDAEKALERYPSHIQDVYVIERVQE